MTDELIGNLKNLINDLDAQISFCPNGQGVEKCDSCYALNYAKERLEAMLNDR